MAATTQKDPVESLKTALAVVVLGVIALVIGIGMLSAAHGDPGSVTCDDTPMHSGDTCRTYRNGALVQTRGYEQVRADHQAEMRTDATWGPVVVGGGVVVVGGGIVSIGATVARAGRTAPARR